MKNRLIINAVLLVTFGVSFFFTTLVTDAMDQHTGYYDQGRVDAREVGK